MDGNRRAGATRPLLFQAIGINPDIIASGGIGNAELNQGNAPLRDSIENQRVAEVGGATGRDASQIGTGDIGRKAYLETEAEVIHLPLRSFNIRFISAGGRVAMYSMSSLTCSLRRSSTATAFAIAWTVGNLSTTASAMRSMSACVSDISSPIQS